MAAALVVVVVVVAWAARRRHRPDPPPRDAYPVPTQLDRSDFPRPDAPWLVAYFWARTCDSCQGMGEKAAVLESDAVSTAQLEAIDDRALHQRYEISAIPMVLMVDDEGVVRRSFVGAVSATDLWAALADARAGGADGSGGGVVEPGRGPLED